MTSGICSTCSHFWLNDNYLSSSNLKKTPLGTLSSITYRWQHNAGTRRNRNSLFDQIFISDICYTGVFLILAWKKDWFTIISISGHFKVMWRQRKWCWRISSFFVRFLNVVSIFRFPNKTSHFLSYLIVQFLFLNFGFLAFWRLFIKEYTAHQKRLPGNGRCGNISGTCSRDNFTRYTEY